MRRSKLGLTLVEGVVVLAILVVLFLLLAPQHRTSREASRRNQCYNNMKQLSLALLNYHEVHGSFPPAYTVNDEGNRLHSWRTLLLPYVEEKALYDTIDLTKPWNDPVNAKAYDTEVLAFTCPSSSADVGMTNYLAVVGDGFVFQGAEPTRLDEITDRTDQTILFVDAGSLEAVHWMSPEDTTEDVVVSYDEETRGTMHIGGFHVAYADGHVGTIEDTSPPEPRQAMLTIAGGESLEAFDE